MPESFGACGEMLATDDALRITGCSQSIDIVRIDPATNSVVARIDPGGNGIQPVLVDGVIWVAVIGPDGAGALVAIDPATNAVTRRIPVDGLTNLGGAVVVNENLWIANGMNRLIGVPLSTLAAH